MTDDDRARALLEALRIASGFEESARVRFVLNAFDDARADRAQEVFALRDGLSNWKHRCEALESQLRGERLALDTIAEVSRVVEALDPDICGTLPERVAEVVRRARSTPPPRQTRVGVLVFLYDAEDRFLLMRRKGSHGAGSWGLPGGHIEFGETVVEAARREVEEECGIAVGVEGVRSRNLWSEAFFEVEQKHYVTVFCDAHAGERASEVRIAEPEKCSELRWVWWSELKDMAGELFLPLRKLVRR